MRSPITSASMTSISTRSSGASRRLLIGAWFAHDSLHRQKNKMNGDILHFYEMQNVPIFFLFERVGDCRRDVTDVGG